MNRTKVGSAEEAIGLADQLRASGVYVWFRGQGRDWPLRSTWVRAPASSHNELLEQLSRYEHWVKTTPGLEELAQNADKAIAVAQHYGLPTNFVDFTSEPRVAGFFAAEGQPNDDDELACIICLNTDDLLDFWKSMPKEYPPPELLELDIPDLWRIEAQHGRFLYCPYSDVEKIYDFDRIYFPKGGPLKWIKREEIYPARKSGLEILLDQFFMNELMIRQSRGAPSGGKTIVIPTPPNRCNPEIFPDGVPVHSSWSEPTMAPWLDIKPERLQHARTGLGITLRIRLVSNIAVTAQEVEDQIKEDLRSSELRDRLLKWDADLIGDRTGLPEDFSLRLSQRLARFWDGARRLPYSIDDVAAGFGRCVALALALRGDFRNSNGEYWEQGVQRCYNDPIAVEFGSDDGSYSRGYASKRAIAGALRDDLLSFMPPPWREQMKDNPAWILMSCSDPRRAFHFLRFASLFVTEIAPFQALARDPSSDAFFYSPARLVSFGLT